MRRQQILTQTVLHIRQIVLQVHSPFPRNSWGQMCFGIKNFSDFIKVTRCTGRTLAFLLLTVTHRGTFNSFLHFHSVIKPKVTKWQNKKQKKKNQRISEARVTGRSADTHIWRFTSASRVAGVKAFGFHSFSWFRVVDKGLWTCGTKLTWWKRLNPLKTKHICFYKDSVRTAL
jgi:hypothetical protein